MPLNNSGNASITGSLTIGASTSATQLNIFTSSVSTQNVMTEFYNSDYTTNTRNFIRVRNQINVGSTMSSYFGQGQDGKTYIVSNDFTKNHIVIDGNSTYVGINKNTPNAQLDVNGNTTVTGSLNISGSVISTGTLSLGTSWVGGTNVPGGYYQDATNAAYRAIITGGTSAYYFQTNNGAATYMYVGLLGTYAGRIGIGTNNTAPNYNLDVLGTGYVSSTFTVGGTFTENSSIRYKDNIETVKYGLDKVLQMRGVTYTKKDTGLQ